MKNRGIFILLFAGSLVVQCLWAQSVATLAVRTGLDCDWKLDGAAQGRLKNTDIRIRHVAPGEHFVQAVSADGKDRWEQKIVAGASQQVQVSIDLLGVRLARLEDEDFAKNPTWTDPATGLMWTRRDNGANVDWNQASLYCSRSRLGGFSDWKVPSIDELEAIYDPSQSVNNWHIKGNIKLSGCCVWSNNTGNGPNKAWYFGYYVGERQSELLFSKVPRVLCVRSAGK